MILDHEAQVTDAVRAAMGRTANVRLREVMDAFVRHAHAFIREVKPSEDEFYDGLMWIASLGHHTNATNNEVVLAADVLGISTLVDLLNNTASSGETMSALLGPFYRANAPICANGENIARSRTPGPTLLVRGRVLGTDGKPLAGALVDAWQSSPVGLYDNQDPEQADMNLRGRFRTDGEGRFWFRSVRPAGYPVPTSGPVGHLLREQHRHPYRPAHVHFIVSAPGHRTLITQIFVDDDEYLETDVTFGVKQSIVGGFQRHERPDEVRYPDVEAPFYTLDYDFRLPEGVPTYPAAPID
jgi:catechol 1,2-dioxygenase